jgi:phospholipase C
MLDKPVAALVAFALLATATACGGGPPGLAARSTLPPAGGLDLDRSAGAYVKHVVIVVQENRSFDNVFAGFPGANAQTYGYMHDGRKVALGSIPFEERDMDHYFSTGVMDYDNGKMDRFDLNGTTAGQTIGQFAYSYLEPAEVAPYWALAKQYVLADHMFPPMFGPSYTAHLTLIAGTADLTPDLSEADVPTGSPWGCDAPAGTQTSTVDTQRVVTGGGPFPCFTQFRTMADTLDAARVSWKYYAPAIGKDPGDIWSSFDSIRRVRYGKEWRANVVSPSTSILVDAAAGRLPSVAWVVPDYLWSDHPDAGTPYGPSWVAAVVNAIGASPDWKSTAIVVVWDDWGGWYDNVPPPQLDFRGLGIRVGCLIVSPYVKPHVAHTVYEFGSILKFVEQTFGLPALGTTANGYTDARSTSILDSFDFTMKPRPFAPIPATYPPSFFLRHAPSLRAPDSE